MLVVEIASTARELVPLAESGHQVIAGGIDGDNWPGSGRAIRMTRAFRSFGRGTVKIGVPVIPQRYSVRRHAAQPQLCSMVPRTHDSPTRPTNLAAGVGRKTDGGGPAGWCRPLRTALGTFTDEVQRDGAPGFEPTDRPADRLWAVRKWAGTLVELAGSSARSSSSPQRWTPPRSRLAPAPNSSSSPPPSTHPHAHRHRRHRRRAGNRRRAGAQVAEISGGPDLGSILDEAGLEQARLDRHRRRKRPGRIVPERIGHAATRRRRRFGHASALAHRRSGARPMTGRPRR